MIYEIIHSKEFVFMQHWQFEQPTEALLFAEIEFNLDEDESYLLENMRTINLPDGSQLDFTYAF